MTRLITLMAVFCIAALGATGCGSSKKKASTTGADASTATTAASTATTPAATTATPANKTPSAGGITVMMKNTSYIPKTVTVKVGQKITWVNKDPFAHTATATSGAKFDSGTLGPGATYSFTPTKPGTIQYWCTIHKQVQTGTIKVVK